MTQAAGAQQTDQTANFFWLICIICGAGLVFWWVDEKYVVIPVFWMRVHEIDVMRFLAMLWTPIANSLHITPPNMAQLDALQHYMQTAQPSKVGWKNFAAINADIGNWTRYPVIAILVSIAAFVYSRSAGQFTHQYNMKTLRVVGQEVWPQITPIISLDLIKQDIDKGPWAMSQPPLAFCHQHDLLIVKSIAGKKHD